MAWQEDQRLHTGVAAEAIDEGLRRHMIRVYNFMTGGLALSGDQLFSRVQKYFKQHHWCIQPPTCKIVPAETGNAAGMIGAAAAARMKYGL